MKRTLSLILAMAMVLAVGTTGVAAATKTVSARFDNGLGLTICADEVVDTGKKAWGGHVLNCTGPVTISVQNTAKANASYEELKNAATQCQFAVYADYYPGKEYASGEMVGITSGGNCQFAKPGIYLVKFDCMYHDSSLTGTMPRLLTENYIIVVGNETAGASAAQTIKSFDDVPKSHWGYDYIMRCTKEGAINGARAADANGVASFEPNGKVTLGQFLAVLTRLLCPELIVPVEGHWALRNYNAAVNAGYIKTVDFGSAAADLDKPLSREDMAYILFCAACANGETLAIRENAEKAVTDIGDAAADRKFSVLRCYSNGLLTGHGDGSFDPKGTMTRAEMAVVVCRLMGYTARAAVTFDREKEPAIRPWDQSGSFSTSTEDYQPVDTSGPIIIYEGRHRSSRPARAGDIFVRKDGTWIELKLGPSGVVGEGQGVAPDLGLKTVDGEMDQAGRYGNMGYGKDSAGASYAQQRYYVNPYTGEGHTGKEWLAMQTSGNYPKPDRTGYNNERYMEDEMCCWKWVDSLKDWSWSHY